MNTKTLSIVTLVATLAACASAPPSNTALNDARSRIAAAQANTQVTALAPDELTRAASALSTAEKAQQDHAPQVTVDHLAYMTVQRVKIAEDTAASRASQAIVASAAAQRDQLRLEVRTNEANAAKAQLAASETKNATQAAALQTANANAAMSDANAAASAEREQAAAAAHQAQVDDLQQQLDAIHAKKTDRGMVVTLGDVLFDTGKAQVLHGASANLNKLADFFKRYPERSATIEGFTDNVGNADSNVRLSERRAEAVMSELVNMGVASNRLTTRAHGEDMPVSDNGTAAGRQMNRRVEIVFAPSADDMVAR